MASSQKKGGALTQRNRIVPSSSLVEMPDGQSDARALDYNYLYRGDPAKNRGYAKPVELSAFMLRDSVATKAPKAIPVAASQVIWDHNYLVNHKNMNQSELDSINGKQRFLLPRNTQLGGQMNENGSSAPMSPNTRNNKIPNTGRLQNVISQDGDGAASQGVANMFLDDYS